MESTDRIAENRAQNILDTSETVVKRLKEAGLSPQESCYVLGTGLVMAMTVTLRGQSRELREWEVECFCRVLREALLTDEKPATPPESQSPWRR